MLRKLLRERRKRAVLRGPLEPLLTALARRALDLAEREAGARGDDRVTAEHLLAGLARLDECVAVRTLGSLGVEIGGARTREAGRAGPRHRAGPL
nr:hypothetical protein GCM10020093_082590 [Planobispora longispora]